MSYVEKPIVTIFVNSRKCTKEEAKRSLDSIINQTFKMIEVIFIGKYDDILKNDYIKVKSNIKNKTIKELLSFSNKSTKYVLFIELGDVVNKTFIETNIISMELKDIGVSYTDSIDLDTNKNNNYIFENDILKDEFISVPSLVMRKDILSIIQDEEISVLKKWETFTKIIEKYGAIHECYYGNYFLIKNYIESNEIYEDVQNKIYKADIINYPIDTYYHEIIKSNISQLPICKNNNKKKNILFIIPWMVVGGADIFNLEFVSRIDHNKYSVTIITTNIREYIWRDKFEEHVESIFDLPTFLDRKDWPTFLEYTIETRNIDIVLISNSTSGYNLIPYIKLKYPTLPIIDYIHSVEGYNRNGGYGRDSFMQSSLIDRTLFCSMNAKNTFDKYFKNKNSNTSVVYIGVDSEKFKPSSKLRERLLKEYNLEHTINIGYICRICYEKRPLLLAEISKKAIEKNNRIKFIIGGTGPLLKELKQKVKEYELEDNFLFLGNVENTRNFYTMCDMTLNCSIKEGLALTAYESLSMGVPIVSADAGGNKELINKDCGVIVPLLQTEEEIRDFNYSNEEVEGYIKGIEKVYKNLNNYKNNCRKRIIENFTLEKMIINMENIIDEVLENKNKTAISNAKKLSDNENMIYEYINNYFMCDEYEYKTAINKYYHYFEPKIIEVEPEPTMISLIKKIHIYSEYLLIKDFIKCLIKIILFPIRLVLIEIIKLYRIIKGSVKDE